MNFIWTLILQAYFIYVSFLFLGICEPKIGASVTMRVRPEEEQKWPGSDVLWILKLIGGLEHFFIFHILPIGSMYGIYANIWGILMVNVTIYIYSIHGSYGLGIIIPTDELIFFKMAKTTNQKGWCDLFKPSFMERRCLDKRSPQVIGSSER